MATITVQYDARNLLIKKLLEVIVSLGGKVEKKERVSVNPIAKDISKRYSDVKAGRTKTRPVSALINEL